MASIGNAAWECRPDDRARDRSGEPKAYLANLICEPDELPARWELCCRMGVDAVTVAGETAQRQERRVLMLNKPRGLVTTRASRV